MIILTRLFITDTPHYVLVEYRCTRPPRPAVRSSVESLSWQWKPIMPPPQSHTHTQHWADALGEGHWLHQEALSKIKKSTLWQVFFHFFLSEMKFLCGVCGCLGLLCPFLCCWMVGCSKSPRSSPGCLSGLFCVEVLDCHLPLLLAPALAF